MKTTLTIVPATSTPLPISFPISSMIFNIDNVLSFLLLPHSVPLYLQHHSNLYALQHLSFPSRWAAEEKALDASQLQIVAFQTL